MQKETPQNHPSTTLNPLKDAAGVVSVDYSSQFNALSKKVENLKNFVENGMQRVQCSNIFPVWPNRNIKVK